MSETEKKNAGSMLTFDDIVRGGEEGLTRMDLESVKKDGGPGVAFLKPLPALEVIKFTQLPTEEQAEAMIPLVAKSIADEDGTCLFDTDEKVKRLSEVSINVYTELTKAVTDTMKGLLATDEESATEVGEASGDAPSSDSPTASQPT